MSQAIINKIMEGATTIPQGSTAQANGAGSARHLLGDDDIVCSLQQCKAALKSGLSFANLNEQKDDQTAFRFVFRVDGQPWMSSAVTPRYSSQTLSPFIKVDTRS